MWQVQMQFVPGSDSIWVARLNADDPIYEYESPLDAATKANELKALDPTNRQYRIVQV